jgi:hypothetical protein
MLSNLVSRLGAPPSVALGWQRIATEMAHGALAARRLVTALTYAALSWGFSPACERKPLFIGVSGERGWDRTIDLLIKSQLGHQIPLKIRSGPIKNWMVIGFLAKDLVQPPVQLTMVHPAERHRELIADLEA